MNDAPFELCSECGASLSPEAPRCPSCGAVRVSQSTRALPHTPLTEAAWSKVERATTVFLVGSVVLGGLQLWLNPAARHLQAIGSVVVLGAGLGALQAFRRRHFKVLVIWTSVVTAAAVATLLGRAVWTFTLPAPVLQRTVGWCAVLNAVVYAWALRRARRTLEALTESQGGP